MVSGAASGIGRAALQLFSAKGYICVGIDNDEAAIARALSELAPADSDRVQFIQADLVTVDRVDLGFLENVDQLELTLVNSVGGSSGIGTMESGSWEEFAGTLTFNLKPLHTLTQACLRLMKRNSYGRIVNVSSITGRKPMRTVEPAYAAAKAAIIGLTRNLALEFVDDGILVNTICPGIIATDRMLLRWSGRAEEINQQILRQIPLHRLGDPAEVAEAIYFLGSTLTYATGCILDVNGGMHMS